MEDRESLKPTYDLGQMAANLKATNLSSAAIRWAKHCILDWIAVTVAGSHEDLTKKIIAVAEVEKSFGKARVIGHNVGLTASQATLVNGAASHALDYDDVNERMNGHPTVPVVPALMALADEIDFTGMDFITAFVAGYEVETLLAEMSGFDHYDKGWHGTATYGTFGAAAASARLLNLSVDETVTALGIASTQAAGLKSMFGTMCKPLHAGKAAANGLFSARLAQQGFTSRSDAIECAQGFAATQAESFEARPVRPISDQSFAVEENLFKYHAACYLTHAGIDALKKLKEDHNLKVDQVERIEQFVPNTHFSVCNIAEPETGLEVKFSMRHTAAMTLADVDTGSLHSYSDDIAKRPDLIKLRDRVTIIDKPFNSRMQSEVVVHLKDKGAVHQFSDAGVPESNLDKQETKLIRKFNSLVTPIFGEETSQSILDKCLKLETLENVADLFNDVTLSNVS